MMSVLLREIHRRDQQKRRQSHKGGGIMKTEAEIGILWPEAKEAMECQEPPRIWKKQGRILLWRLQRE